MQKYNEQCARTTAMFMWAGMMEAKYRDGGTFHDVLQAWDRGCIELAIELSEWGPISERLVVALQPKDFPGVYDYEVSESFGQWVGQHLLDTRSFPERKVAMAELRRLAVAFFKQGAR